MLDPVKIEAAEASIDCFIDQRSKQREEANALQAIWRASELRVLAKRREENRVLWIEHFRRLAACNLAAARDYRRRARALEANE